jgi:predicted AAA+ superfamily ATPase
MYQREILNQLLQWIEKEEILILYGARQVGKTTLMKELVADRQDAIILNCEIPTVSATLESIDLAAIGMLFGENRIICLDEAQKVSNIGRILKLVYDEMPAYKIIASGSSSFDLANKIVEPLTGRNVKFRLFPLSLKELTSRKPWLEILQRLNDLLVYGSYPGIVDLNHAEKKQKLLELSSDYLYQDILAHESVKQPAVIRKLLKALALQAGSQVSVNELSRLLGISRPVVEKYLDLLEKTFVIFQLSSFSSNLRNEIRKSSKYYFWDNGILNAMTGNFTPIGNRSDVGHLWENFCISERMKHNSSMASSANTYFWRTYDGAEIDFIEETAGNFEIFEFKWKFKRKTLVPSSFANTYPVTSVKNVSPEHLYLLLG